MKRIVVHIDRIALRGVPPVAKLDVERAIAAHLSHGASSHAQRPRSVVVERIGAAVARAVRRNTGR